MHSVCPHQTLQDKNFEQTAKAPPLNYVPTILFGKCKISNFLTKYPVQLSLGFSDSLG